MTTLSSSSSQVPIDTIVGSGLYVIPADHFARVSVFEAGGAVFINGTELIPAGGSSVSVNANYTPPTNLPGDLYSYGSTYTSTIYTAAADGYISGTLNMCRLTTTTTSYDAQYTRSDFVVGGVIKHTRNLTNGGNSCAAYTINEFVGNGQTVEIRCTSGGWTIFGTPGPWKAYTTGTLTFSEPVAKPVTANVILNEGDTITGGAYVLSLYSKF